MLTEFNSLIFTLRRKKWKENGGIDVCGNDERTSGGWGSFRP